jgi:hypothetical protein
MVSAVPDPDRLKACSRLVRANPHPSTLGKPCEVVERCGGVIDLIEVAHQIKTPDLDPQR